MLYALLNMNRFNKRASLILFLGDLLVMLFSLWLTLLLRTGNKPDLMTFKSHLAPFSILFVIWIIVFFIAGLYDKQTLVFRRYLPTRLFNAQLANIIVAVFFFYLVPFFEIAPKTILFINLIVSLVLISVWRMFGQGTLSESSKERALIIGQGGELIDLVNEVNNNQYGIYFDLVIDLDKDKIAIDQIIKEITDKRISVVIVNLDNNESESSLKNFYNLIFSRVRFIEFNNLYEEIFDRIPVSSLSHDWFIKNISLTSGGIYDVLKKGADMLFAFIIGLISLISYPFIIIAIRINDGGPVFIKQKRIGQDNKIVEIIKFRSMSFNDNEDASVAGNNKITAVGKILRQTRLDELPQLWNVLRGDLSLIGPRPELPNLASRYEKEIPYYSIRHLIKPGLSGWAQIHHENHPHRGLNVDETKNKLSYDLFYLKNRSFWLDLQVSLKTIKTLLSRVGR